MSRALVYVADHDRRAWIVRELQGLGVMVQIARTVCELVAALIDDPPPRPQLLFIDVDPLAPGDLLHLHTIREQGWFGSVFAIGKCPLALRHSLNIERVLAPNAHESALRAALATTCPAAETIKLPKISG